MISTYTFLVALLVCIGLFYSYQYIQEEFAGRGGGGGRGGGRGGVGRGGGRGWGGRGSGRGWGGRGRGRGWGGGWGGRHYPRGSSYYYPTYYQDYDTPDVYIYPVQNFADDVPYTTSFSDYLRWLFGYQVLNQ